MGGGRIGYLDALKCLGILLVIEGHVRQLGMGIKVYDTLPGIMLYSFNMPIFFFVSGFFAYKSSLTCKEIGKRTWQKFLFLFVPAFAFSVYSDLLSHDNPLDMIHNGFGEYWFTFTLFECFIIYYIAHVFLKKEKIRHIALVLLAIAGVCVLSVFQNFGPAILDTNHLTKYFQFFVTGILAMRYKKQYEKLMNNENIKAITILAFFALLFSLDYSIWPNPVFHVLRDVVLRYLGTFIVLSFFVCQSSWFDKESKVLSFICKVGKRSLAIYLLQYFFIPHLMPLPSWLEGMDRMSVHVFSLGYSFVILATCMLFITLLMNSKIVSKYVLGQK